jgi:hypothetical protein
MEQPVVSSQGRNGSTSSRHYSRKTLLPHTVKENHLKGVYVENMSEHRTRTLTEAYSLFLLGL